MSDQDQDHGTRHRLPERTTMHVAELEALHQQSTDDFAELQDEAAELRDAVNDLKSTVDSHWQDVEGLEQDKCIKTGEHARLVANVRVLKAEQQKVGDVTTALRATRDMYTTQRDALRSEENSLHRSIRNLGAKKTTAEAELDAAHGDLAWQDDRRRKLERKGKVLEDSVAKLKLENNDLQSEVNQRQEQSNELAFKVTTSHERLHALQRSEKEITGQLFLLGWEKEALTQACQGVRDDLARLTMDKVILQQAVMAIEAELEVQRRDSESRRRILGPTNLLSGLAEHQVQLHEPLAIATLGGHVVIGEVNVGRLGIQTTQSSAGAENPEDNSTTGRVTNGADLSGPEPVDLARRGDPVHGLAELEAHTPPVRITRTILAQDDSRILPDDDLYEQDETAEELRYREYAERHVEKNKRKRLREAEARQKKKAAQDRSQARPDQVTSTMPTAGAQTADETMQQNVSAIEPKSGRWNPFAWL
jgi:hypothetical protein